MNTVSKIITTFTVCEFLNETVKHPDNLKCNLQKFSEDCEQLGGNKTLFFELATRELDACRLLEQEGGDGGGPANVVAGVAGLKPEDIGVPVEAQKRYTSKNSIFRRKKPNKYYSDKNNSY